MTGAKDEARIRHMLDSTELVGRYVLGVSEASFLEDAQLQDSVVRRLEIIGEAAAHVSEGTKEAYPEIAWRKAAGLRNILAHEYFNVDMLSVWVTVTEYVPLLHKQLEEMLAH